MKTTLTILSIAIALDFNALAQTPRIRFEASSPWIETGEADGTCEIGVIRDGPTDATSKVLYKIENTDVIQDAIVPIEGQLVFAPGERRQVITLAILDNPKQAIQAHAVRMASLVLYDIEGATFSPDSPLEQLALEIDVWDNEFPREDPKSPPVVFRNSIHSALTTDRSAAVELWRLGDSDQPLTFNVATADQTAKAGVHYIAQSGSITFAPLETKRTITVPLLARPVSSREVTFELMISGDELGSAWTNRTSIQLVDGSHPGTVDASFDAGELLSTYATTKERLFVEDMALLPDGRLYVGGHFETVQRTPRDAIARLLPNGRLDSTFQEHSPEFRFGDTHHLYLQADGRLLAGYTGAFRFHPDGSGDPTLTNRPNVIAVLPDGKFLVVTNQFPSKPFRLDSDGTRDPSFRSAVELLRDDLEVLVDPDGKIVMSAYFQADQGFRLVRLLPDGGLDASFGKVSFDSDPVRGPGFPRALARQPDGRYLVAGELHGINKQRVGMVARLNSDGTLDSTFAIPADLFLLLPLDFMTPDSSDFIYDLALQPDGKILVGGQFINPLSTSHGGLVRLNPDGSVDSSFDIGAGAKLLDWTGRFAKSLPSFVKRIVLQPDGQILVAGMFTEFDGFPRAHLVRLNGDSKLLKLSAQRASDNSVQLQLTGPANQRIVLEAASSLSSPDWQPLSTNTITTSPLTVTDPDAAKFPRRFYRAVSR